MIEDLLVQIDVICQFCLCVIVIGVFGCVGLGVVDLLEQMGVLVMKWDMVEIVGGGLFLQILIYDLFINCILVWFGMLVFVGLDVLNVLCNLIVIGDVVCDLISDFNLVLVYDRVMDWVVLVVWVVEVLVLDVMVIDNLFLLLLLESVQDFVWQLLLVLMMLDGLEQELWQWVEVLFCQYVVVI